MATASFCADLVGSWTVMFALAKASAWPGRLTFCPPVAWCPCGGTLLSFVQRFFGWPLFHSFPFTLEDSFLDTRCP